MSLNLRQQRFVSAYLLEPNATKAAVAAGYSERTAYQIGSRLLKHVEIEQALNKSRTAVAAAVGVDAAWVLAELVNIYNDCEEPRDELKAMELIGKHKAVAAFVQEKGTGGTMLVVLRDFTGRAQKPVEIDVTPA